jgi:hypothetical protein
MSVPTIAFVKWMDAKDHANETLQHPSMDVEIENDALNIGPTMIAYALCDLVRFEENVLPRKGDVDNNYNVTRKDGCFH